MLELLFTICMLWVLWKLLIFGIKATWGITKIVFSLIFLPLILVGMVVGGLISLAFPLLIVAGIVVMVAGKA